MKTSKFTAYLVIFFLVLSMQSAFARIWRVNSRTGITADFATAQAAHNGATAGDTLYFEPSPNSYGSLTLTKKLVLIGTGYFLGDNPETLWKTNWPAYLGYVTFSASGGSSSEFSQMMGMTVGGTTTVNVSNITIRRNNFSENVIVSGSAATVSDLSFCENYCNKSFSMSGSLHDITISNNIFLLNPQSSYPYYASDITGTVTSNGIFKNNVVQGVYSYNSSSYGTINIENFIVQNNIVLSQVSFYPNNNVYSYNIASTTGFGNQNGNQQNVDMNTVFVMTGTADGKYVLKAGSPAIGAGAGGVDCGAFGGPNPYVLSGMPPIPAVYYFMIGDPTSPYNVQLKVKSHN